MSRVGLLTYHFSDNYGALMQAYALRRWFQRRGHDAEFVNYHPRHVEEGGAFDAPFDPAKWRRNATILYMKASHLRRGLFGDRRQSEAFARFRRDRLGVAGPRIETAARLAECPPCDLLVCGSDQIWNPSVQYGLDPVYFLDFPGSGAARRISYAPSFGRATLDPASHGEACALLRKLDAISVREASGVDVVRGVAGREAVCVPDPTLLLGDFSDLLDGQEEGPTGHVFCYALRAGEPIRQVAGLAARALDAPILSPYNVNRRWRQIGETIYPSPAEWLRRIGDAALVVTNSFHGVALSIVLGKEFISVALPGGKRGLSERVVDLLAQTGLSHRLVNASEPGRADRLVRERIDWAMVEERLAAMRRRGEAYLDREIENAGAALKAS